MRAFAVGLVALAAAAPAAAASPGSAGLGDPFFPNAGNGGYDVREYALRLQFDPARDRLEGRARISAEATQELSSFNLDLRHLRVLSVRVGGERARYSRRGSELTVVPAQVISPGSEFTAGIRYTGRPRPITDDDGSREGWFNTGDGSIVVAEPRGAPSWFPVNDTPTDKATFRFAVTVPRGLKAIANGRLRQRAERRRGTTWRWSADEPMAPYLATVATGRFRLQQGRVAGVASLNAVDPGLWRGAQPALRKTGRILTLFESLFGPYPFSQGGAIVDDASGIGYALETQTRPVYDGAPDDRLVAHELAHQWFGNSVSLTSWPEIWLNEGFATWAEWRWAEQEGGRTTAERLAALTETPADESEFWNPPPAMVPAPAMLFSDSVYVRGAMALEALRQQVGEVTFLEVMRDWVSAHAYANATIAEFIALAESRSGQDLGGLFDAWLYQPGKP
jgi:aminopeptidase N